jgi:hypothetical protein
VRGRSGRHPRHSPSTHLTGLQPLSCAPTASSGCRSTQPCHVAMGAQPTCTATSHSVGSFSGTDGSLCLRPEPRAGRSEQPASDAKPRSPNARSLDPDINATLARCHENWLQPEALGNLAARRQSPAGGDTFPAGYEADTLDRLARSQWGPHRDFGAAHCHTTSAAAGRAQPLTYGHFT